jgi:hypothetical protein
MAAIFVLEDGQRAGDLLLELVFQPGFDLHVGDFQDHG